MCMCEATYEDEPGRKLYACRKAGKCMYCNHGIRTDQYCPDCSGDINPALHRFIDRVPHVSPLTLFCYKCCRPAKLGYEYDYVTDYYMVTASCHMGIVPVFMLASRHIEEGRVITQEEIDTAVRTVLGAHQ